LPTDVQLDGAASRQLGMAAFGVETEDDRDLFGDSAAPLCAHAEFHRFDVEHGGSAAERRQRAAVVAAAPRRERQVAAVFELPFVGDPEAVEAVSLSCLLTCAGSGLDTVRVNTSRDTIADRSFEHRRGIDRILPARATCHPQAHFMRHLWSPSGMQPTGSVSLQ
jgi:hypothetical protein